MTHPAKVLWEPPAGKGECDWMSAERPNSWSAVEYMPRANKARNIIPKEQYFLYAI